MANETDSRWRIGLDLGSTSAKGVLIDPEGAIVAMKLEQANTAPAETADRMVAAFTNEHNLSSPSVAATGYGRSLAGMAVRTITEISCHARGVRAMHPDARSVIDIGGQDAKAIRLDANGGVEDFAMNDRCAAGTGCFLDVAAKKFNLTVAELSAFCDHNPLSESAGNSFEISSTCVVFAESELIGLTAKGTPPKESLKAVHRAIARRVILLLKQVSAVEPLYFTGGVAANGTLRHALEKESGLAIRVADHAQFAGALGAALFL